MIEIKDVPLNGEYRIARWQKWREEVVRNALPESLVDIDGDREEISRAGLVFAIKNNTNIPRTFITTALQTTIETAEPIRDVADIPDLDLQERLAGMEPEQQARLRALAGMVIEIVPKTGTQKIKVYPPFPKQ